MTRTYRIGLRVLAASLCFSVCSSTALFAQRADRAVISGVVTDEQGGALPGATVTIHNEATGVDTVLVTNAPARTRAAAGARPVFGHRGHCTGFKKAGRRAASCSRGGEAIRHDVSCRSAGSQRPCRSRDAAASTSPPPTSPTRSTRSTTGTLPIVTAARRAARGVRAADPARLSPHASERRPDVPRQPIQLADQRRSDDGDRELLRRRSVRLRGRTSAEPREHAARRGRPGSEGHLDDRTRRSTATPAAASSSTPASPARTRTAAACMTTLPTTSLNANGLLRRSGHQTAAPATTTSAFTFGGPVSCSQGTTATTRRSSSSTSTTRGCAPACCRASATRRPSTRSRQAISARCYGQSDRRLTCSAGRFSRVRFSIRHRRDLVNGIPVRDPVSGQRHSRPTTRCEA